MVFKIAKCRCGYQRYDTKPTKEPGACKRCGASLFYLENWYYSFYYRGRKYTRAGGTQKRFAEDALSKERLAIRERKFFPDKAPETPWKEATGKFLSWAESKKAPGTYDMYRQCIKALSGTFSHFCLDEIGTQDVEDYIKARLLMKTPRKTPVKNATVNREIATLKRLCSWATEQRPKLLLNNVIEKVTLLKENNARTRFLSEGEIRALLEQCRAPHLHMAVVIALETGLRKDGVLTLQWTEISGGSIHKRVKGGKVVHIPVTHTLEEALSRYRGGLSIVSRFVIPSPDDPRKHMRVDSDIGFDTACARAKIEDFRFHDLRHTFASHFLMRTGDMKTLQEILGHADLQMTQRYTHLLDEHKRKQMEMFDEKRKEVENGQGKN